MSKLVKALRKETNHTQTTNGATAFKSTLDAVLDLFGKGGAMQQSSGSEQIKIFMNAYQENPVYAMRVLFYLRDIRGGQGNRSFFRNCITHLAKNGQAQAVEVNFDYIAECGRWDDFYSLVGTPLEKKMFAYLEAQAIKDVNACAEGKKISLLSKWLKSANTSSKESCRLGTMTQRAFKLSPRQYREMLSKLRAYTNVVEVKMSDNEWADINYEQVPSNASKNYRKAFKKHDGERYDAFIKKATTGEAKINSATLYPHELVINSSTRHDPTLNAQWNQLPDFTGGMNALIVADVSSSMWRGIGKVQPMNVSIAMGIYFAERNKGPFKNHILTFAEKPSFYTITGNTLHDKIKSIKNAPWGGSTDLNATFDLILDAAVKNNLSQEDLPETLIIVSDMQFNKINEHQFTDSKSVLQVQQQKFKNAGFKCPSIVFWNVNALNNVPVTVDDTGTCLVSGFSTSIFKTFNEFIKTGKLMTPVEIMLQTLDKDRYKNIFA